jgi:GTPase
MLISHQHPLNRSIMVAVLGAPNVGKSSLVNYLMGVDLSVVTDKPQTTRNKINCVFTVDHTEIILVDTPGVHRTNKEFNKRLNQQARDSLEGADLNLLLIDSTKPVGDQISEVVSTLNKELTKTWVVFTKSDLLDLKEGINFDVFLQKIREHIPSVEKTFLVSSVSEENMNILLGSICDEAKEGPHLFDEGQMSNKNERFFVGEYIREQAFELLKEELPYEIAVVIDEYKDLSRENDSPIVAQISASILVNRPSQRAIVVGSKGSNIKEIGSKSRMKIERLLGGQIGLKLHVKVSEKWFKNNMILEQLGLHRAEDSNRVWRAR